MSASSNRYWCNTYEDATDTVTAGVNGVVVSLQRKNSDGSYDTLATQQLDFSARETLVLNFQAPISEPGVIELRIIADPDDLIA